MKCAACRIANSLLAALLVAGITLGQSQQQPSTNPPAPVAVPMPSARPSARQSSKQTPAPVLRTTSDLVRIDVEVTDKSGRAIKGLRADQFVVTDDGKPQAISTFSYEDIEHVETAPTEDAKPLVVPVDKEGPNTPSAAAASEQLRDRRLIVLFFDLTSMHPDDLIRAHDAA